MRCMRCGAIIYNGRICKCGYNIKSNAVYAFLLDDKRAKEIQRQAKKSQEKHHYISKEKMFAYLINPKGIAITTTYQYLGEGIAEELRYLGLDGLKYLDKVFRIDFHEEWDYFDELYSDAEDILYDLFESETDESLSEFVNYLRSEKKQSRLGRSLAASIERRFSILGHNYAFDLFCYCADFTIRQMAVVNFYAAWKLCEMHSLYQKESVKVLPNNFMGKIAVNKIMKQLSPEGEYQIGTYFLEGKWVPKSIEKAERRFIRAAQHGNIKAISQLCSSITAYCGNRCGSHSNVAETVEKALSGNEFSSCKIADWYSEQGSTGDEVRVLKASAWYWYAYECGYDDYVKLIAWFSSCGNENQERIKTIPVRKLLSGRTISWKSLYHCMPIAVSINTGVLIHSFSFQHNKEKYDSAFSEE